MKLNCGDLDEGEDDDVMHVDDLEKHVAMSKKLN